MRSNHALLTVGLVSVLLLATGDLTAAEAKGKKPDVDPKAEKVLKALAKSLADAKALQVKIGTAMVMKRGETERKHESSFELSQERPNKILLVSPDEKQAATVVSDGKQLTIYGAESNRYIQEDAPKSLTDLFSSRTGQQMLIVFGGPTFLPDMLAGKPYDKAIEDVGKITYVGQATVDKAKVDHLKITQKKMDWQLWVSTGKQPRPVKIVSDLSKMLGDRQGENRPSMTLEVTYADWKTLDKLAAKTFAFKPPAGAEKFDPSAERPRGRGQGDHALVGKAAPDFEIPTLDGKTFKLSAHKGKSVVVLDFWATWCGPCVRALPILVEVTDAYAKKGVVFCAVNLREGPSKIKPFLKRHKLDCLVGLDKDGSVASAYKVEGIPQSVIVGKDGKVAKVHVGMAPNLKEQLSKELDELVGGK